MNRLRCVVEEIQEGDVFTSIRVQSLEGSLNVIKSKAPEWMSAGDEVYCNFQEARVSISKECPGKISIENSINVSLKHVRRNKELCELTLECALGEIVALITSKAYENIGLYEGAKATALLKGIDISIEPIIETLIG